MSTAMGKIRFEAPGDVWVFAYGSLMWAPEFEFEEIQPALLRGYHRSLCVHSLMYRGTPDAPGLVLGLDRGGSCVGRVMRVAETRRDEAAAYLEQREMQEDIYFCRHVPVTIPHGRIRACAFIVNRDDPVYAGRVSMDEMVRRIATCAGARGRNIDYLRQTVRHLDDLGITEGKLHTLLRRVEAFDRRSADAL